MKKYSDDYEEVLDTVDDVGRGAGSFVIKMSAILGAVIGIVKVLEYIMDSNIDAIEHTADLCIRGTVGFVKIFFCGVLLFAFYKVFLEPSKQRQPWED